MKKIIILSVFSMLIISCGIPESDYKKLLKEKVELEKLLDECNNGAERIEAKVYKFYKENNFKSAKENIVLLSKKHPQSEKNNEFDVLYKKIVKEENKLHEIKLKSRKDSVTLANVGNTGVWNVKYYVDDFGEPTKEGYITHNLSGLFSNSATQNSKLNIRFLITKSSQIDFKLYEYARSNPVKSYGSDRYRVLIQDSDGERYKLIATNYSDRLSFGSSHSKKVHKILLKGGTIKFSIYEIDTPTSEYKFTIQNSDYYGNAYRILTTKK